MRARRLLNEANEALAEAQAEAIAAIGLRGQQARHAMIEVRRKRRDERWRGIVADAKRHRGAIKLWGHQASPSVPERTVAPEEGILEQD